jgi:magnesium transporter
LWGRNDPAATSFATALSIAYLFAHAERRPAPPEQSGCHHVRMVIAARGRARAWRPGMPSMQEARAMLTIYKTTEHGLKEFDEASQGCWIHVVNPSPHEIARLKALGILPEFVTYPLDIDERSRVEREDGQMMVLLRVPFAQEPEADIPFITLPLGIILVNEWIVTICSRDNEIIGEFTRGRVRGLATAKRYRFILHLLLASAVKYLYYLRQINRTVDSLEDQLQLSMRNRELMDLLKYQKSLVYFTTALKSNEVMMERLQRMQLFRTFPDDEDLLEDALTETQQAIEMTNIASNILSSMMDAFASIISNNMNIVIKFLTAVTIVLTLPTLISSFYGMNVPLPLQRWPYAALIIFAVSVGVALLVARVFVKRDWM